MVKPRKFILLFMLLYGHIAVADSVKHDQDPLADLLRALDQETEIATRTKLNIDFVPGMVTVLRGRDLLLQGFGKVFDALATVPGIELTVSGDGQWQVMVRGVGKSFASAKVKILLNGVPFNSTMNAVSTALVLPIKFVDRIEVIRGPGSALYGEFASVGVINIITLKEKNEVFVDRGSDKSYTLGGQTHHKLDNGLLMNFSFSEYGKKSGDVQSGPDLFATSPLPQFNNFSQSPGIVNDSEHNKSFNVNATLNQYQLNWQFVQRGFGDYFGLANVLSSSESVNRTMTMHGVDLAKSWKVDAAMKASVKAGWLNFSIDGSSLLLFPAGTTFLWDPFVPEGASFPDGVLAGPNYKEDKYYAGLELEYSKLAQHDILFGLDYSVTKQGETYALRNYRLNAMGQIVNAPYQRYTGAQNWMEENLSRRLLSVYVQDQLALTEKLRITSGLRFEEYSDLDGEVLPRLAVVYQPRDYQTVKFQYAQSFRPPTFMEKYVKNNAVVVGNKNLKSEKFDNYEVGYAYNNGLSVVRTTVFHYFLKNMIVINSTSKTYENQDELSTTGAELEYRTRIRDDLSIDAGMLYSSSKTKDGSAIPGAANLNANLGLVATPWRSTSMSAVLHYVGERKRQQSDNRADLNAYKVVDFTLKSTDLWIAKTSFSLIIKNVFDEKVVYPSFLVRAPDGGVRPGYVNDYPQSGRRVLLQFDYAF